MFIEPPHDQEVHFMNNSNRMIRNVTKIEHGQWFHLQTEDGVEYIINPDNVTWVRVWGVPRDGTSWKSLVKEK